jgi:hypothetical protein
MAFQEKRFCRKDILLLEEKIAIFKKCEWVVVLVNVTGRLTDSGMNPFAFLLSMHARGILYRETYPA